MTYMDFSANHAVNSNSIDVTTTAGNEVTLDYKSATYLGTTKEEPNVTMEDLKVCDIWTKSFNNDLSIFGSLNNYRFYSQSLTDDSNFIKNYFLSSPVTFMIPDTSRSGIITYSSYDK